MKSMVLYDQYEHLNNTLYRLNHFAYLLYLEKNGIKPWLISEAFVYHKRRNNLSSFYKQMTEFGKGRVLNGRKNKDGIKMMHWFPTFFLLGLILILPLRFILPPLSTIAVLTYSLYFLLIFFASLFQQRSLLVAAVSVLTSFLLMIGYGWGFLREFFFSSGTSE